MSKKQPRRGAPRSGGAASSRSAARRGARPAPQRRTPQRAATPAADATPAEPRVFRLGVIPGATPGKWISIWRERMPEVPLELVPLEPRDQLAPLLSADVDAALARRPVEHEDVRAITLYDEVPVVVVSKESTLTAADELTVDDLAGEVIITAADDVLHLGEIPGTTAPRFAAPETTADAVATVATGVGVIIVPMSVARLHHRKDVEHRPFLGGPLSTVALVWHADRQSPDVDTFIGIVRGRTANSSRG